MYIYIYISSCFNRKHEAVDCVYLSLSFITGFYTIEYNYVYWLLQAENLFLNMSY